MPEENGVIMPEGPVREPHWTDLLNQRWAQKKRIADIYSDHYRDAGVVGHDDLLFISWLCEILNRATEAYKIDIPALYQPRAE